MLFTLPTRAENKLFGDKIYVDTSDLAEMMGNRMHTYWLADYVPGSKKVFTDSDRSVYMEQFDAQTVGARPVIPVSEVQKLNLFGQNSITYGEYPQDLVTDSKLRDTLDKLLQQNKLNRSGKKYSLPFARNAAECAEFEYQGEKYVKVSGLNNWFKVKPIKWVRNDDSGPFISQNVLFTSMWNDCAPNDSSFNPNKIKLEIFLRDVFAKEIETPDSQIQLQQLFPKQTANAAQNVNNVINQTLSAQNIQNLTFSIPTKEDMNSTYYMDWFVKNNDFNLFGLSNLNNTYWIDDKSIISDETIYTATRGTFYGVRPLLSAAEAQKIKSFMQEVSTISNIRLKVYEFGEFPQSKVDRATSIAMAQSSSLLRPTGKKYHTQYDISSSRELTEYSYKGKKYACSEGEFYEVEPIRWIQGKDGSLLSENVLFSSLWGKRDDPDIILDALNNHFAKEILAQGNAMQNSNIYPHTVNQVEIGEGITVSDLSLEPEEDIDTQGGNNQWLKPTPQPQNSHKSSANSRQIPVSGGATDVNTVDEDYEEQINSAAEVVTQIQKGNKTMNGSNKNSVVVVDETPMSVTEQIEFYVKNGMSFMLHGPSGIGKTARVEQIDPDLTAVPLWNGVLPEDIVGKVRYPSGQEVAATEENMVNGVWVEPDWYVELKRKCADEPEKMHVLFIDEVTNARPTTQSLIFHLTLKKSITPSKGKLPENSVVVLAGNNRNESEAAYNMPEPLFRRMSGHIYLEPNVREWMVWGSESSYKHPNEKDRTNIHPLVTSFVGTYGEDVFYSEYNEEESKYALDPRGWEQISDIIYDNHGVIRRELLVAKMGTELAANFLAFAKIPQLSVEDVVNHNYDSRSLPRTQDARLALTLNLRHADDKQQKEVRRFITENLGKEYGSVFDAARASSNLAAQNRGMAFKLGGWGRNG